ncbi:acyltransferase family protein [Streptomyces sp. TR06-5]|uniref:acyltransferase family protein n=1 Tax=unclassified Streptomyces TaxID=2593676 RepID=UPI0039A2F0EC
MGEQESRAAYSRGTTAVMDGRVPRTGRAATTPRATRPPAHRFRGDVEGLRALAVGAVLAYHAGVGSISGGYVGVDVFFVVSGFLITGLLLRELETTGTLSLVAFYARRMRRLLPQTLLVLGTVVALSWLLMSPVERAGVAADVIAAGLYVVNWQQAQQAVDYSAMGTAASPVQHFWSLSVEEQFYLVWPLLLLAVFAVCRRPEGRRRRLAAVLGATAAASLSYSVYLTWTEAGTAYFSTFTRAWELAAGGLLAAVPLARWQRLPRRAPAVLGAAGLAAVALSMVWFDDVTPFPGIAAVLPVLGTAAIIAAGTVSESTPVGRLLNLPPVRYVGRISYAWYLWHWPAIVFATVWFDGLPTSLLLLVVALSWIPAALSHRFVEEFFRRARVFRPTRRSLWLGFACTALAVVVGAVSWLYVPRVPLASPGQVKGVAALRDGDAPQQTADALRPLPEDATEDRGRVHKDGCLVPQRDTVSPEPPQCVYGDTSSDTTVVLFGDSHAMQYTPALARVARERGWKLMVLTKSGCTPADVATYNGQLKREYTECATWRRDAMERIDDLSPEMVVTGNQATTTVMQDGMRLDARAGAPKASAAYAETLEHLRSIGSRVVVMADNPHPPQDMPSCVSESLGDLDACAFPKSKGLGFERVNKDAAESVSGARLIDPSEALCQDDVCPAVVGNALVYRNSAHITATYMRTMTDWLDGELPASL